MEATLPCRCCLLRPPDKDLRTPYVRLGIGVPEVYMDMLENSFEIHVILGNEGECGICEVCVRRLRDASDFKLQVQRSQAELPARLAVLLVKGDGSKVKSETSEMTGDGVSSPEAISEKEQDGKTGDSAPGVKERGGVMHSDAIDEEPAVQSEVSDDVASDDGVSQSACDEYDPSAARRDHTYARTEFPPVTDPLLDVKTAGARDKLAITCSVARDRPSDKLRRWLRRCFTGKPSLIDQKPYRCKICSVEFSGEVNFTDHLTTHIGPKGNCGICHEDFPSTPALISHIIKHTGQYNCDVCKRQFVTKWQLLSHDHTPHACEKLYSCNICKDQFKQKVFLKSHMLVHAEEKPFPCKNNVRLNEHTIIHPVNTKYYTCDICQKQCKFKKNLIRHIRVLHTEKCYPCDICPKSFIRKTDLNSHMSIHTRYTCDICKQDLTRKRLLRKHIRSHMKSVSDLTSLSCGICKKQFTTKKQLEMHTRIHTDQKPYLCEHCSKSFKLREQLKLHTMSHTGEKPHACEICKKQFLYKGYLTVHMRIHTLEFPYSCDVCCKKFYCRSNLRKHIRTHTGEKPYSCKICNKRFSCSRGLVEHGRIHSGDRPYNCKECSWQFKRSAHLRKHEKRFHAREKVNNSESIPRYSII